MSKTYAITSGSLPTGLSLDSNTGILSGTPDISNPPQLYLFGVVATDSVTGMTTGPVPYSLTVESPLPLVLSPTSLPAGQVGINYSATISASGGAPGAGNTASAAITFAVTSGSLPPGLSLDPNTGILSGIPTSTGTFSFTITATDNFNLIGGTPTVGSTGGQDYMVAISFAGNLLLSPAGLPGAVIGVAYSATVSASGGSGSYTYSVSSGTLPPGLSLDSGTGAITGTPTTLGTYPFTITAADNNQIGLTGSDNLSLVVSPIPILVLSPSALPVASTTSPYSASLSASGGTGPYTFSLSLGSLPPGISLSSSGVFSGTATTGGSFTFTVKAVDTVSPFSSGTQVYTVNVAVTTPSTGTLRIPNFGAFPTITSITDGNWSSASTWSPARVPIAGDIVSINTVVTYDSNDSVTAIDTVVVQSGALFQFSTTQSTELVVTNFLVTAGGELDMGTQSAPIPANITARLTFPGTASLNSATDPESYGCGLIILGKFRSYGAAKTTMVILAVEAVKGATSLTFQSPVVGWQIGDSIQLPDTRQLTYGGAFSRYTPQYETVKVATIAPDGMSVTLQTPLLYSHLGGRGINNVLYQYPDVQNMTRNVSIHSSSPTNAVRGYVLATNRADVISYYTQYGSLGRTNGTTAINNTAFDSNGHVTHLGTNQENRNAVTFLNLWGPASPQPSGYQFTFVGNVVQCSLQTMVFLWGVSIRDSHYGLFQFNNLSNWYGSGLAVVGAASYNNIDSNFIMRVIGTSGRGTQSLQGVAFWFGNPNNTMTNNVASTINGGGWTVFSYGYSIDVTGGQYNTTGGGNRNAVVPTFQGADPTQPGQSKVLNMNHLPLLKFSNNKVYGSSSSGMTIWWIGTFGDTFYADQAISIIENFTTWNIGTRDIYLYPCMNIVIDNWNSWGDLGLLSNTGNFSQGLSGDDYMTRNLVVQNCNIQGRWVGIKYPFMVGRNPTPNVCTIKNINFGCATGLDISPPRSVNGNSGLSADNINLVNNVFVQPSQVPARFYSTIFMDYTIADALGTSDMSIGQTVQVTNYNGLVGDNFRCFYSQEPAPTDTPPGSSIRPSGLVARAGIIGLILGN